MIVDRTAPTIYEFTGEGASPSWLWLADSMERLGVLGMHFGDFQDDIPGADAIVISGGDVGKISRGIGDSAFSSLLGFVKNGGTYVGLCAGAYLPLHSIHSTSSTFGTIEAPIVNIAETAAIKSLPDRYKFRCGDRRVYQIARGPVRLHTRNGDIVARMIRGPIWRRLPEELSLATYTRLEDKAERYASEDLIESVLPGNTAAISAPVGKGRLLLFGPHPEHPDYPEANAWLLGLMPRARVVRPEERLELTEPPEGAKRAMSLARDSLAKLSGTEWTIGERVWNAESATHYLDAMRARMSFLERSDAGVPSETMEQLEHALSAMKSLQANLSDAIEANVMFLSLSRASSAFLNHYFEILRRRSGRATN
ncbi:MAG TPA: hypothetical protein VMS79_03825 [Methanomassiliicoccales archaeon]|nr:hypothetical protein [Methanomassiliicoccales archaeon]